MEWTRRDLIRWSGLGGAVLLAAGPARARRSPRGAKQGEDGILEGSGPVVVSTWGHGVPANDEAMRVLGAGGSALDAVEAGARVSEADPDVMSVGRGGLPNEDGVVQLDAAIMDGPTHRAGGVGALEKTLHPVSVARRVMETTRHVLLVGEGARLFARRNGFPEEDLLTDAARRRWLRWRRDLSPGDFWVGEPDHDTIGILAMDGRGDIAAACTTSGLAWKIPGRVGDSPLVGDGLYADQEVGAAAATGVGEAVIRSCGSFLVVEGMRAGLPPLEACRRALERIRSKESDFDGQVAFVALRRDGRVGGMGLRDGFRYAVARGGRNLLLEAATAPSPAARRPG